MGMRSDGEYLVFRHFTGLFFNSLENLGLQGMAASALKLTVLICWKWYY